MKSFQLIVRTRIYIWVKSQPKQSCNQYNTLKIFNFKAIVLKIKHNERENSPQYHKIWTVCKNNSALSIWAKDINGHENFSCRLFTTFHNHKYHFLILPFFNAINFFFFLSSSSRSKRSSSKSSMIPVTVKIKLFTGNFTDTRNLIVYLFSCF